MTISTLFLTEAHLPKVVELEKKHNAYFDEDFGVFVSDRNFLSRQDIIDRVMELGDLGFIFKDHKTDIVVGYCLFSLNDDYVDVTRVILDKDVKDIVEQLLKHINSIRQMLNLGSVYITINEVDEEVIEVLSDLGFITKGVSNNAYGERDGIILEKKHDG